MHSIEERVARLEGALGWSGSETSLGHKKSALVFGLMLAALSCAYLAFELPNHYYQIVLGALVTFVLYHKGIFVWSANGLRWILPLINAVTLTLCLKIFIGAGDRFPFFWFKYPNLESASSTKSSLSLMPSWSVNWEPTQLSLWNIDMTNIQSFLLLAVVGAGMLSLQLLASVLALFLVFISLPALVEFNWDWAFPALVLTLSGFYLQTRVPATRP